MEFKSRQIVTKDVTHLKAELGVRYWEDAKVNGEDENENSPDMPFAKNGVWRITIDLATGAISDWPKGTLASTHYKVCDDGAYSLLDATGAVVAHRNDGYVPSMLAPNGKGYGDYVILDIDANGVIAGWKADLSYFNPDKDK